MNRARPPRPILLRRRAGFVLLEAMLAVAIFALGMLALGRCVSNCISAERFKLEDTRARQALANRVAEIESSLQPLPERTEEKLKGSFEGITLRQRSVPLKKKNEQNVELTGLRAVTLEVSWLSGGDPQSRQLTFYVRPRNL